MSAANPIAVSEEEPFVIGKSDLAYFFNNPCRCDCALVLLCTSGHAQVTVDLRRGPLQLNTIVLLLPGSVLMFDDASADFSVRFGAFSPDLFGEAGFRLGLSFFSFLKENPISQVNERMAAGLSTWFEIMDYTYQDRGNMFRKTIVSNFYGVHSVTLYVDSVQVFNSTTDKVLPDENRMINGFTDYEELTRTRRLIMRSYKLPGNRLRLLHPNENRGAVTIDEERDYHFRYVLEDNFGNRRTYQFIVKGKRQDIPEYKPEANEMLYWNRTNVIQKPGMELVVPRYYVYEDVPLRTDMRGDSSHIAFDYILDAGRTPIHSYCDLSIGLRHMPVADTTKYYIVQKAGKWRSSMGGKYANGWIKTRVRSLGTFSVDVDTIAPQITPIGQGGWRTSRNIRFRIKDMESGIGSYKVYIDGKFVLFGLKKGILVIQNPEKVKKGVSHKLEVTVTDQCGNMTRKEYKF